MIFRTTPSSHLQQLALRHLQPNKLRHPTHKHALVFSKRWQRSFATKDDRALYKDQDDTFVDRHFPPSIKPYAKLVRLDRPIGTTLLMLPGWFSIALAAESGHLPDPKYLAVFGVGAFVMRSAGCTINDMWDRDIDGKVERTKNRPIASGQISMPQALVFLAAQLSVGLYDLCFLNNYSIALGASSLGLVVGYPLAKRFFAWPQLVLGLTFNWGALLGWAAVHGSLQHDVTLPLYAGCVSWTLLYDTIYAHQDKHDDKKLGLRSSALTIGDKWSRPVLAGFGALTIGGIGLAGFNCGLSAPFYCGLGLAGGHLAWQVATADFEDRVNLTNRFVSNQWTGSLIFASIVAGKMF